MSSLYVGDDIVSEFTRPLFRRRSGDDQAESRYVRQRVDSSEERVVVFMTNVDTTRAMERDINAPHVIHAASTAPAAPIAPVPALSPPNVPKCHPSSSTRPPPMV